MKPTIQRSTLVLGALLALTLVGAAAYAAERPLTLNEAIDLALQKNEGLMSEREGLAAAKAAVSGASGAYDPLLEIDGGLSRSNEPVNSAFSGTTPDRLAPETRSAEGGAAIHQLLPTGRAVFPPAPGARGQGNRRCTPAPPPYS